MHKKLNKCSKLITKFGKWILGCYTVSGSIWLSKTTAKAPKNFPLKSEQQSLQRPLLNSWPKQAWRMASMSARILKADNHPQGDFLAATLGSTPTWIWHSILDGREVIQRGLIRQIGTGKATCIWNMDWVPTETACAGLSVA
jgi:hypothetical protein